MERNAPVEIAVGSGSSLSHLFSGIVPAQLHVHAVLQGDAAGCLYVDSRTRSRVGCLLAGEACYVGGSSGDEWFHDAVNEFLPRDRYTAIFAGADVAAGDLVRLTRGLYAMPARRRAATLRRPPTEAFPLPPGVALHPIDRTLLAGDIPGSEDVREAVLEEWQTLNRFLERGFGTAAESAGRWIAHSISDYVVGRRCEIGIHVASEYRRRGIGTAVAAATAREAFGRGMEAVTWHSWANNAGSIGVSRRLGFCDEAFYTVLFNHWAAENIADMSQEEFRGFGEACERMFAERPPAESGYPYVVAATAFACGRDRESCLRNLHRAIDMGWLRSRDQLRELWPELFGDPTLPERVPEWKALFGRLGA